MIIPPSADRFLTSFFYYQTINILFVNMKNKIVKVIFSADRVAP